jgi:hypothetical protein
LRLYVKEKGYCDGYNWDYDEISSSNKKNAALSIFVITLVSVVVLLVVISVFYSVKYYMKKRFKMRNDDIQYATVNLTEEPY